MDLFAWHNIVFLSALGVGVLIVIGAALGGLDTGDADLDGDVEMHDGPAELLGILDIGQIPFTVLLMVSALIFGLSGMAASLTLGPALGHDWPWLGVVALVIAAVLMVFLTARAARLIIKHLPASESHVSTQADLLGAEACMFTKTFADVQLAGDVHRIHCRSDSPLEPGMRVTVVDYDPETQIYDVSPLP
ncbi:MAG TPA: hypothetical protein VM869_07085 [Enhygromyxa sp.]|nr:hypothetical protein [Enhygromyxa sp.]